MNQFNTMMIKFHVYKIIFLLYKINKSDEIILYPSYFTLTCILVKTITFLFCQISYIMFKFLAMHMYLYMYRYKYNVFLVILICINFSISYGIIFYLCNFIH